MKEARFLKGLMEGSTQRMPCHLCTVLYKDCNKYISPDDIEYRNGYFAADAVDKAIDAERCVLRCPIEWYLHVFSCTLVVTPRGYKYIYVSSYR